MACALPRAAPAHSGMHLTQAHRTSHYKRDIGAPLVYAHVRQLRGGFAVEQEEMSRPMPPAVYFLFFYLGYFSRVSTQKAGYCFWSWIFKNPIKIEKCIFGKFFSMYFIKKVQCIRTKGKYMLKKSSMYIKKA